jgi:aminopeptidase N
MKSLIYIFACMLLLQAAAIAQKNNVLYTKEDSLRGSNGSGRSWWDVLSYDLEVRFNHEDSTIAGRNKIQFNVLATGHEGKMQIDLQRPLSIKQAKIGNREFAVNRTGDVYFIQTGNLAPGKHVLEISYEGKPRVAIHPPWDGGVSWDTDQNKNPWISISCQGLGASVWYPCKDYQGDEPDSAKLTITAPSDLVAVGNGRLKSKVDNKNGTSTSTWQVINPINSYCIIPYIGKYVHFGEKYKGEKGTLDLDYWVLEENLPKAKKQFKDVIRSLQAFEHWFGPYPFYEDSYKLVDAPYLGMEHQSAIAYGNQYKMGYMGSDLSGSGWGLKFDFIIIHENAHEWWGNNVTTKDIADMWVHESFGNYAETLFMEYHYGKTAANAYVQGIRKNIDNDVPIIGPYGVNKEGSGDMYYKGANMLHTIRQIINDDVKFRNILRGLNSTFYHKIIDGKDVEQYIIRQSGKDLSKVFDQYLRDVRIPQLQWKTIGGKTSYRWTNVVKGFDMPVKILMPSGKYQFVSPNSQWKTVNVKTVKVDPNFYVEVVRVN